MSRESQPSKPCSGGKMEQHFRQKSLSAGCNWTGCVAWPCRATSQRGSRRKRPLQVWQSIIGSLNVATFSDPMIDCKTCKGRFRADQTNEIPCPQKPSKCVNECHGEKTGARAFNLMFQTYVGPVQDDSAIAYLRPETAQAIFAQFKNVLETSRQKVPFGIAQVGKAFRNEVTPRNFTFRSREFEQMELEFFIKPDEVVEAIHGSVFTVQG